MTKRKCFVPLLILVLFSTVGCISYTWDGGYPDGLNRFQLMNASGEPVKNAVIRVTDPSFSKNRQKKVNEDGIAEFVNGGGSTEWGGMYEDSVLHSHGQLRGAGNGFFSRYS